MKKDIIVQRAKTVIKDLGLCIRIDYLKQYKSVIQQERRSENDLKRYILLLAEDEHEQNFLFVNKVLKQINLLLL